MANLHCRSEDGFQFFVRKHPIASDRTRRKRHPLKWRPNDKTAPDAKAKESARRRKRVVLLDRGVLKTIDCGRHFVRSNRSNRSLLKHGQVLKEPAIFGKGPWPHPAFRG